MKLEVVQQTVGVDYLTVTATKNHSSAKLARTCHDLCEALKKDGSVSRPWKFQGYTGQSLDFFNYGTGPNGAICMVAGPAAYLYLEPLVDAAGKVTRIDFQVTVMLSEPYTLLGENHWWQVRNNAKKQGAAKKFRKIQGSDGGYTLYVGSRQSGRMLRIYDKGVQSGELAPGLLWRYEVELKKPYAVPATSELVEFPNRGQYILGVIYHHCGINGIVPVSNYDDKEIEIEKQVKITTPAAKLNWLSTSVKPTVAYLSSLGYNDQVLKALGLSQLTVGGLKDLDLAAGKDE